MAAAAAAALLPSAVTAGSSSAATPLYGPGPEDAKFMPENGKYLGDIAKIFRKFWTHPDEMFCGFGGMQLTPKDGQKRCGAIRMIGGLELAGPRWGGGGAAAV